jgi:hypothetical protein
MKNLNRFAVLFCISTTLTSYSQIGTGGFKINNEEVAVASLPEVLLSFDAVFDSKKVELTWSSTSEINNNFYAVEKSKDGIVFEEVVSIKGFGNNSSLISYFEADYNPFDGISFYRLKQTNANGIILSSRLVSINNIYSSNSLSLNTGEDHSSNLLGSENKEVIVVLRNEKGIETYSKVIIDQEKNVIVSTDNETKLDIGTYLVIASSDNKLYSQKLVIK